MARGRCNFKEADVKRALRATVAAGIEVQRVEFDPVSGKIVIIAGGAEVAEATALDAWRATRGAR